MRLLLFTLKTGWAIRVGSNKQVSRIKWKCRLCYLSCGVNNFTVTSNIVLWLYVEDSIGLVVHVCVGKVKSQT